MCILAVAWIIFVVGWLWRGTAYQLIYTVSGLGYAALMIFLAVMLRRRWAQWLAVIILALNIVLTLTDQVGIIDLVYLLPSLVVFWLLIMVMQQPGHSLPKA